MNSSPHTNAISTVHIRLGWILILLALVAYTLPWLVAPSSSLSPGAYDLAEWMSLHPAARYVQPPLLPSLLLRLPLACLGLIIAFAPMGLAGWARGLVVLVLGMALLPPIEFFTLYRNDPNYQQQFGLALFVLISGVISLSRFLSQWRLPLAAGLAGIATAASLIGLKESLTLFQELTHITTTGAGIVLFTLTNTLLCIGMLWIYLRQTKTG